MRTVRNDSLSLKKNTQRIEVKKVLEACVPISPQRSVFYDPFAKSATFSKFIDGGRSEFIESLSFRCDDEPEKEVVKSLKPPKV